MTRDSKGGATENYSSPEIWAQEEQQVNYTQADIYSLAMSILKCCGITNLYSLGGRVDAEDHKIGLRKLLESHQIKENYGSKMVTLLTKMSKFNREKRIGIKEIIESLKDIVKEIKKKEGVEEESKVETTERYVDEDDDKEETGTCEKCGKIHKEGNVNLPCKQIIGWKCLHNYLSNNFLEDSLFQPKCPIKTCGKNLSKRNVQKLIENYDCKFDNFFGTCDECEFFTYELFLRNLPCEHQFCEKCMRKALNKEKCLKCTKALNEKKCDDLENNCRICGTTSKNCFYFICCKMELCKKCFLIHFLNAYQEKDNSNVVCKNCWKNLSSLKLKEILDEDSQSLYKDLLNKPKCSKCQLEKDESMLEIFPKCEHQICKKCLKEAINDRENEGICPVGKCKKKIPNEILEKYQETQEKESYSNIKKKKKKEKIDHSDSDENQEKQINLPKKNKDSYHQRERSQSDLNEVKKLMKKEPIQGKSEIKIIEEKGIKIDETNIKEKDKPQIIQEKKKAKLELIKETLEKTPIIEEQEKYAGANIKNDNNKEEKQEIILIPPQNSLNKEEIKEIEKKDNKNAEEKKDNKNAEDKKEIILIPPVGSMNKEEFNEQKDVDEEKCFCEICKQTVLSKNCVKALCGHTYCHICLITDFKWKMSDNQLKNIDDMKCPSSNCPHVFPEQFIYDLKHSTISDLYRNMLSKKLIGELQKQWEQEDKEQTPAGDDSINKI